MDVLLRTQVAALYKDGWTVQEIAEELNLSEEEVIQVANKVI